MTTTETTLTLTTCPACKKPIRAVVEWEIETDAREATADLIPQTMSACLILSRVRVSHDCKRQFAAGGAVTAHPVTFPENVR